MLDAASELLGEIRKAKTEAGRLAPRPGGLAPGDSDAPSAWPGCRRPQTTCRRRAPSPDPWVTSATPTTPSSGWQLPTSASTAGGLVDRCRRPGRGPAGCGRRASRLQSSAMPINPDAVGYTSEPSEASWNSKDCLLYALGVGAGVSDPTGFELEFTTENSQDVTQRVLPTFPGRGHAAEATRSPRSAPSTRPCWSTASSPSSCTRRCPAEGTVESRDRPSPASTTRAPAAVVADRDRGHRRGNRRAAVDHHRCRRSSGAKADGAATAARPGGRQFPDRAPDHTVTYPTRADQALLYRLSGDRNPLHSDPKFAAMGGFDKPILHGLCTFGFTGRALLHTLCGSDPDRFVSMAARFSKPVFPGQELTVSIWNDGEGRALFRTSAEGAVVIDAGQFEYH